MPAEIVRPTPENIRRAADILRSGGLIGMPTETVYGLATDASNAEAVARLFEVKGRPHFNPLIAHVNGPHMAAREVHLEGPAAFLAGFYWPGPLTLVLPVRAETQVCELARSGLSTLGVRHPSHSVAHDLITAFGRPVVAPSANRSGRISPVTARDVAEELGDQIDLILDGGRCPVGLESTILAFPEGKPTLLRPGGLEAEQVANFLGEPLLIPSQTPGEAPLSPGQMLRHYAPNARLRLDAVRAEPGEVLVGFGPMDAPYSLSQVGNLREAAANLFPLLRFLDRTCEAIAISPIPRHGLGAAINDRLRRAAHRDS